MVIFISKQNKFEGDLKIKLCSKRLYPTEIVFKYLGIKIDTNLSWQYHVNDLSIKLNRANALLFKMRKYVSLKILRSIYFAIFDSYLSYCCLVWAQVTLNNFMVPRFALVTINPTNIAFPTSLIKFPGFFLRLRTLAYLTHFRLGGIR